MEPPTPSLPWRKYFSTIFLFFYFITWALGVPSMYSDVANSPMDAMQTNFQFMQTEFQSWRSALQANAKPEDLQSLVEQIHVLATHSRASGHFEFAIPLAPCVILSKHDALWGGLAGRGGLFIYLWPFKRELQIWAWQS